MAMFNLYGNGIIGRVDVVWDSIWAEIDPGDSAWVPQRADERYYYIWKPSRYAGKDHFACPPKLLKRRRGSIRITIDSDGEIVSAQDYYAFGEVLRSYNAGDVNDKYKLTEKERDVETGLDYFGARYYDPVLGIWKSIDPLWEKYRGWSPYNYVLNNPLIYIDPDGRNPWVALRLSFAAVKGIGYAVIGTGATIQLLDNNAGKLIIDFGVGVVQGINNIVENPVTPVPFPITQGEGINQTVIAPSDATNVGGNSEILIDQGMKPITSTEARKSDLKQVDHIAKKYDLDRKAFGDYIHKMKEGTDRRGAEVSKETLETWAKEFKENNKK